MLNSVWQRPALFLSVKKKMMDDFKPKEEEALGQKIVKDSSSFPSNPILYGRADQESGSGPSSIDVGRKLVAVDMRAGQMSKGWTGLLTGAAIMLFGVAIIFRAAEATNAAGVNVQVCVLMVCTLPALIGLLFFCSAAKTLLHRWERLRLSPGKFTWDAEFKGDHRFAVNESPAVARKYLTNFLVGHIVIVPAFYLACTKALEYGTENLGPAGAVIVLGLWYLLAAYMTMGKFKSYIASRKLTLALKTFPFFLGKTADMTMSTNAGNTSMRITKVILQCILEETVWGSYGGGRKTLSRQAWQLYAETREFGSDGSRAKKIQLAFELPDRDDLSTSLLSDDPIYWLLSVEGYCDTLPIDAAFLLPLQESLKKHFSLGLSLKLSLDCLA